MNKAMRCLWLVVTWSSAMVGLIVAIGVLGWMAFWSGSVIALWLGADSVWGAAISAIIAMAIYGAGVGAYECRSKLKRGEL